jgi:hypothetical protein
MKIISPRNGAEEGVVVAAGVIKNSWWKRFIAFIFRRKGV